MAAIASPSGPRIAGKHGLSLLSIGATLTGDLDLLGHHWNVAEERAAQFGTSMNRDGWRLVGPMHLAETREQAYAEVEHGLDDWCNYLQHIAAVPHFEPGGDTFTERVDWINNSGIGVIGTPEDAIRQINVLDEQSNGGFGAYLMMGHEWANPAATARHYELFAEAVAPHFQGRLDRLARSEAQARAARWSLRPTGGRARRGHRTARGGEGCAAGLTLLPSGGPSEIGPARRTSPHPFRGRPVRASVQRCRIRGRADWSQLGRGRVSGGEGGYGPADHEVIYAS
ncbi:hypothetical protein [Pseudonocardia sp. ICBG1293]|uniref:hypothetical protein n=1 Tax=Pseudonocardia sp. ICBG1293 TaxID=2844382 RepID=UPI001CC94FAD|nr:hypothetical protein [Pseudonocardia sp. ICBG1293]